MLAQEYKDQIMIQKAVIGTVVPKEQSELNRIGRQRNARSRGEEI